MMDNGSPKSGLRARWDRGARGFQPRGRSVGPPNRQSLSGLDTAAADVICCGMYRACSTWQYEVVAHLLERHRDGRRLGYLTGEQYHELVRSQAPRMEATTKTDWRVFKSHEGYRDFAVALARGRAVAVYAYRDVRDVVFSLMHKRGLTFEQLLRQGLIHQVLANDRFWTRQPNVLIQRYEEMLGDPLGAVRALADHLGIVLDEAEATRIADEYSLESNKARTEALRRRLEQAGMDLNTAANAQICDSNTLLHWNHVRNGGSSWFAESTPRQRRVLHRLCARWLRSRNYALQPAGLESGAIVDPQRNVRDRIRIEADLLVGWLNHQVRRASQRFPRLAVAVKRMIGSPTQGQVGATVWSESKTESSVKSSAR
jgi:Sulfotransferase domain